MKAFYRVFAGMMAAGALALGATAASATTWVVTGTFDDGTTLAGKFTVNVYGYVSGSPYDLTTQDDLPNGFTGNHYVNPPPGLVAPNGPGPGGNQVQFFANGPDYYTAYTNILQLTFENPLTTPSLNNPLIGIESWECEGSFNCPDGAPPDPTRYLTGFASAVPEPTTWALMLVGFGGLGYVLRRSRREMGVLAAA
jgi:hypothetical protein